MGILAAIYERQHSGRGQVIDAAMVDGASSLMTMTYGLLAAGAWRDERGANLLDGGAPWYGTYQCADGKYVAVGALERSFFAELMRAIGLDPALFPNHMDRKCWPEIRATLKETLLTRSRDEWCAAMADKDCCFAPVLAMGEASTHPQLTARQSFVEIDGLHQPGPAPRFSRSPGVIRRGPPARGEGGHEALGEWGVR
jgi:alpha-methylacyl-CoA racemase